jgi:hypothetical protein
MISMNEVIQKKVEELNFDMKVHIITSQSDKFKHSDERFLLGTETLESRDGPILACKTR